MSFVNLQVDPDELPAAQAIEFQPMSPDYPREVRTQGWLVVGLITLLLAVPAVIVVKPVALKWWLVGLPVSSILLGTLIVLLQVRRARTAGFALRTHDLSYRVGLYWRRTVVLPFNRVQHAEVSIGPLQRRFGLASLKLYTAGGTSIDLRIDGLTTDQANQLRDHVAAKARDRGEE